MKWWEYAIAALLAFNYTFIIVAFLDAPLLEDENNENT